jgi:hypothetical protein
LREPQRGFFFSPDSLGLEKINPASEGENSLICCLTRNQTFGTLLPMRRLEVPMTFEDVRRLDGLPAMWAVLLYRINQSEERDRVLRDWEDVVFGPGLRQERGLGIAALSDVLGDRDR